MPGLQLHSTSWSVAGATRGGPSADADLSTLPADFLTAQTSIAEEVVLTPPAATTRDGHTAEPLDFSYDIGPTETAVVALRQPSGALTFHAPEARTRGGREGN